MKFHKLHNFYAIETLKIFIKIVGVLKRTKHISMNATSQKRLFIISKQYYYFLRQTQQKHLLIYYKNNNYIKGKTNAANLMENLLRQLIIDAIIANQKMDICFYNSLQRVKKRNTIKILFHILSCTLLYIFGILTAINNQIYGFFEIFLFLTATNSTFIFMLGRYFYHRSTLRNIQLLLIIAKQMNHTVRQGQSMIGEKFYVSSEMYNAVTDMKINDPVLSKEIRLNNESQNIKIITIITEKAFPCFRYCVPIMDIFSVAYLIMAIIKLSQNLSEGVQMQEAQILYFSLLISIGVINGVSFIFKTLVLIMSLILILFLCIRACCCCCFASQQGAQLRGSRIIQRLPESKKGSQSFIQFIGDSCSICRMDFDIGDQTIALRCNDKHIFHRNCIQQWIKIKPDCPTCRTPI